MCLFVYKHKSLQCECCLRKLRILLCNFLDLIILIIVFISVTLIAHLPTFSLNISPPLFLLFIIKFFQLFFVLWVFVLLLYLIISLLNSLRWKSSRRQIPAVTPATELVQTNSCCQHQGTITVSGHFHHSKICSVMSLWSEKNIYRRPSRDATPFLISKHGIFKLTKNVSLRTNLWLYRN